MVKSAKMINAEFITKNALKLYEDIDLITELHISLVNSSSEMRFAKSYCDNAYSLAARTFTIDTIVEGEEIRVNGIDVSNSTGEAIFGGDGVISKWLLKERSIPVKLYVVINPKEGKFGVGMVAVK